MRVQIEEHRTGDVARHMLGGWIAAAPGQIP
jgi:hypothetical protein